MTRSLPLTGKRSLLVTHHVQKLPTLLVPLKLRWKIKYHQVFKILPRTRERETRINKTILCPPPKEITWPQRQLDISSKELLKKKKNPLCILKENQDPLCRIKYSEKVMENVISKIKHSRREQ